MILDWRPCLARFSNVSLAYSERYQEFNLKKDECIEETKENFWLAEAGKTDEGFTMDFCNDIYVGGIKVRNIGVVDGTERYFKQVLLSNLLAWFKLLV